MIRAAAPAAAVLALIAASVAPLGAKEDPVQWSLRPTGKVPLASNAWLELKASIAPGWHLYSPTTPEGGPIVTTIKVQPDPAIKSWQVYRPQPVRKLDPNFQIDTETYTGDAIFPIEVTGTGASAAVQALVRYQACSDVKCLPPVKKSVSAPTAFQPGGSITPYPNLAAYALVPQTQPVQASVPPAGTTSSSPNRFAHPSDTALVPFLLTAFGAGLLALFTPCVFPMIPLTISFFVNQNQVEQKRNGVAQAFVFCAGIVVLFTALGFAVTALAGPFGVVQLGSSPWVNGFIALVFFVFGLSLLGAFELRLPSGLLTRLDRASQGGGYAGSLLMGLTFSLTSFACIGPIVGPLLLASVQSKGWQPVLGMVAFACGLALPFFFLALFPAYLQRLPRSGAWMMRVKVVLGFLVLAILFKYLSNVDQVLQTQWLTRERFLAAWIVLFSLAGLYLLGFLRMEGIRGDDQLGVGRALTAAVLLSFAVSLVPGLFGAPLRDLDAFIPESAAAPKPGTFKNDLDGAIAAARSQHKLILVNFTGYACTNCHWMKANMFTRPEIATALNNLILADLYTDGTDTDSDKNQKFEDEQFHTVSIPFYALIDPDRKVIATFPQLTRDPHEFLAFLNSSPSPA